MYFYNLSHEFVLLIAFSDWKSSMVSNKRISSQFNIRNLHITTK